MVVEAARPRPAVAEAKVAKELQVRHLGVVSRWRGVLGGGFSCEKRTVFRLCRG